MPPPMLNIDGNNYSDHSCLDDSSSATETATNNGYTPLHTPLTPTSLISSNPSSQQAPSLAESPTRRYSNSNYSPSLAPTNIPQGTAATQNTTYENGLQAFFAGRFNDARTRFKLAASECRNTGDAFQEAECLLRLGMTCRHLEEYPNAFLTYPTRGRYTIAQRQPSGGTAM
ncbi:hypothetical protein B0J17DRAFT_106680 [Rhizoctonia solani]|nr:hypothetical protein B0J17DRAFT_106680 [Rhizoctonia solani]